MKFIGMDDKEYNIVLANYIKSREFKSDLHEKAESILKELIPSISLYHEVYIPGCADKIYIDIMVVDFKLAIEIQGQQHYKYNTFFFKDKKDFLKAQKRDKLKKEWCDKNKYTLIELKYNEESEWKNQIIKVLN